MFFTFFSKSKKRDFLRFFEVPCQKNVKKRTKHYPSFHNSHVKIANWHFRCKTITHIMLYNTYIRINVITLTHICFWLKYNNGLVSCEGQQKWLRVVTVVSRTICYHFYVFFKIQKVVTFYVFCRVSYFFSNYGQFYEELGKYERGEFHCVSLGCCWHEDRA